MPVGGGGGIVIFGSGSFAARILFDLAAVAEQPLEAVIVGRDEDRLAWLRTGAMARAAMFGRPVRVEARRLAAFTPPELADLLGTLQPRVVVNTASVQGGRRADGAPDGWTSLVRRAGLGVTSVLQTRLSRDIAVAVGTAVPGAYFVNCCYPDVVNPMLAAAGLPITCGIGNVAILAHAFAGTFAGSPPSLHLLAQHAALAAFRRPARERQGAAPLRLWLDGVEIGDVFTRFAAVKLAPEPVVDVSGASGIPLFLAMLAGRTWQGHAPGPSGRPGGYPVRFDGSAIRLDLPAGLSEADAIAWNERFEAANGVIVSSDGMVRYTGAVEAALRAASPDLAAGFRIAEFDAAFDALATLRSRLLIEA